MDISRMTEGIDPQGRKALASAGMGSLEDLQRMGIRGVSRASFLTSYEEIRSDRAYLNYLIAVSGQSKETLEQRYHQWFPEREGETDPIRTIQLCIEVLLAHLEEKGKTPTAREDWASETGDPSDYGYLHYLLSEEAGSQDEEMIRRAAHVLSEEYKISFFVDPLEVTTRVLQCIRTLQAVLREGGIVFDYRRQWVQRLDQTDYPENFLQVKQRLIRGNVEALLKQLDDCKEILASCHIKKPDQSTIRFSEADEPHYAHFYENMQRAIGLIKEMVEIDDLVAAGHRHFYDEAYQWAIGQYSAAYHQIQRVLRSLSEGLHLASGLGIGYPLEDIAEQIDAYFMNLEPPDEDMSPETLRFRFGDAPEEEDLHGGDEIPSTHGAWKIVDEHPFSLMGGRAPWPSHWYKVWHQHMTQNATYTQNWYDLDNEEWPNRRRGTFLYFPGGEDWTDYQIRIEMLTWSREGHGDFGVMFRFALPPNGLYYRLSLSMDDDGCVYLVKGGRPLNWDKDWKDRNYILLAPESSPETPNPTLLCGIPDTGHDLWWKLLIDVSAGEIAVTITPHGPGFDDSCRQPDGSYPSFEGRWKDPDFIPKGTIALYSYGMFCRWSDVYVTLYPKQSILHSNPFQVSCPDDIPQCLSHLSPSNYHDRLAENPSLQSLQDLVCVTAEGYQVVDYGIGERSYDEIDDFEIIYNEGDSRVNRLALAQLLTTLPYLIPHYWFYVLPIALGDCYREMGDFGQARAYYNLVYQPAGLVQHIRAYEFEPVHGEWDLESTDRVIKKHGSWSEQDYVTAGSKQWSNYELELEAQRTAGYEGFLIFLRYAAEDHWLCWDVWKSVIESRQGETVEQLETSGDSAPDIVSGRWYKIHVVARDRTITCSVDGTSLTCELPPDSPHLSGCIGLGASRTIVEYRDIRLTLLQEEAIYPYLNPSIEVPLMRMRLAQNYIDWGDYLYRQQDDESVDLAKEMYKAALCVHEAEDWCEQDLYGSMEKAVSGLMEAEPSIVEPQMLEKTVTTMEELRQGQSLLAVKKIYEEVANIVTADITQESIKDVMVALSGPLGWDYVKFWKGTGVVEGTVSGSAERTLLAPGRRIDQPMVPAYASHSRSTESGSEMPTTGMVPYGDPPPVPNREPENPLVLSQKRTACLRIYAIEQGLNYLGYRNNYLSIFRYAYLAEQAKAFADLALSAEREFLSFREKFERESLTNLQARQALALALAAVQLEELRRLEAADRLAVSRMQVDQVYAQMNELERKLADIDWWDYVVAAAEGAVPLFEKLFEGGGKKEEKNASGETAFHELIKGNGRLTNAVEEAGESAGLAALGGWPAVLVKAGIGITKGILSVEDQKSALEAQIKKLKTQDLPLAKQNMRTAKDQLMIAVRQKDIAILKAGFAQDILEFLKGKFLNVEMWSHLARSIREIYELYLEYAITLAWMAERALEFERGAEINRIKFNYFSAEKQGLLAAENLIKDMASLEYDKLVSDTKKNPIKQGVSLAQRYPYQFGEFLRSGQCQFYLPLEFFDLLCPGLYQARLKSVELILVGDLPQSSVRGMLTNLGTSRVRLLDHRSAGKQFVEIAIYNPPETVVLSAYDFRADQAMFRPSETEKMLLPFEGLGVDSYWMLDFSQAFADLDFSQIIDVQLVLYFTAEYDDDLKYAVLEAQPPAQAQIQPFSLRLKDPEAFEAFVQPEVDDRPGRDARLLSFVTGADDFPPNQTWRRTRNLVFYFKGEDGAVAPLSVHLSSGQHPQTVRDTSESVGLIASNVGEDPEAAPKPLNAFSGLLPTDHWSLKVLPEENPDWQQKNALGRAISDAGNGFLRLSGSSGTATPPAGEDEWPTDLHLSAKLRVHRGAVQFNLRGGVASLEIYRQAGMVLRSQGDKFVNPTVFAPESWYTLDIVLIQDIAKVFVDGLKWLEGEVGCGTEGTLAVQLTSGDTEVDLDDIRVQQVDQFAMPVQILFEQYFTLEDRGNAWTLEGDDILWQVEEEEAIVNPRLDLSELEDILLLLEYEYGRPGPPLLHINPDTLNFGEVLVDKIATLETRLFNNGGSELIVTEIASHLPDDFVVAARDEHSKECPFTIPPGQFLKLYVGFEPEKRGVQEGLISVTCNDERQGGQYRNRTILVKGQGVGPSLLVRPAVELDFEEVLIGDTSFPHPGHRKIELVNRGERLLEVTLVELTGDDFHTSMTEDEPVTIQAKRRKSIPVIFVPREPGKSEEKLRLQSNDPTRPEVEIRLVGEGKSWLAAKPDELRDEVNVGAERILKTEITNETTYACEIQELSIGLHQPGVELKVMAPDNVPFRLMPDDLFLLKVSARPKTFGVHRASVEVLFSKWMGPGAGTGPDDEEPLLFSIPIEVEGV